MTKDRELERDVKQELLVLHGAIRRLTVMISGVAFMILLALAWPVLALPFALVSAVAFFFHLLSTTPRIGADDQDLSELRTDYLSKPKKELEAIVAEGTTHYRPEAVAAAKQVLNDRKESK